MIYTGFFDAAFDEETGTYDREYDSADFTGYFEQIIGSGVCVYSNDDSMKVYYDSASQRAVVNPGYLFIRGYWLKNDGLYTVSLEGLSEGTYAIRAVLSMSACAISIGQVEKADPEEYPDSLVLAYATIDANNAVTVEDTRSRTDICGLIDAAGSLSQKVEYAINYINNEIDAKLEQIKEDLQAQEAIIDGKIEEANGLIAKIAPPAVGTIKFSASQDVGEEWLRCDGRFVNEVDYPELVAALGKNYPSGDKFQLLNTDGVGAQISNGVICEGKLWVFSYTDRKLYGIDVEGDSAPKVITLTSSDSNFSGWQNPNSNFLALSIIPNLTGGSGYRLFLAQINSTSISSWDYTKNLVFSADFNGQSQSISMSPAFSGDLSRVVSNEAGYGSALPYVVSQMVEGQETFYMNAWCPNSSYKAYSTRTGKKTLSVQWDTSKIPSFSEISLGNDGGGGVTSVTNVVYRYLSGFKPTNQDELVYLYYSAEPANPTNIEVVSETQGIFERDSYLYGNIKTTNSYDENTTSIIAGSKFSLLQCKSDFSELKKIDMLAMKDVENVATGLSLPPASRVFIDAGCYLFGKDIFMLFVGTGIVFSRDLTTGSFGYLDTTSVLGTITQYANFQYSQDEGTLYIVGQDTTNSIKAAKIVLNTLFDYASDGAWLPMIASDGIPAYIKAIGEPPPPEPTQWATVTVKNLQDSGLPALTSVFQVLLNDETLVGGTNMEYPVTSILKLVALQDYTNPESTELDFRIYLGGKSATTVDAVVANSVPLLGKVLSRGGSVTRGEEVQISLNMENLQSSGYSTFWFITKSAQGS